MSYAQGIAVSTERERETVRTWLAQRYSAELSEIYSAMHQIAEAGDLQARMILFCHLGRELMNTMARDIEITPFNWKKELRLLEQVFDGQLPSDFDIAEHLLSDASISLEASNALRGCIQRFSESNVMFTVQVDKYYALEFGADGKQPAAAKFFDLRQAFMARAHFSGTFDDDVVADLLKDTDTILYGLATTNAEKLNELDQILYEANG